MTDCDLWEGTCYSNGYGYLHIAYVDRKRHRVSTHRLVWMQDNGQTDLQILHSCDTPNCINIDHLRAGTQQDNMDDKMKRGRNFESNKTHCNHGHEFTAENTQWTAPTKRSCRTCNRRRARETYFRRMKHELKTAGRPRKKESSLTQ